MMAGWADPGMWNQSRSRPARDRGEGGTGLGLGRGERTHLSGSKGPSPVHYLPAQGIGIGEHRSSLTVSGDRKLARTSWVEKRPERATFNSCSGTLPGGLQGTLGHQMHLTDQKGRLSEGDHRYQAFVGTVVFAELPEGARASFNLTIGPPADFEAGVTIGKHDPGPAEDPGTRSIRSPRASWNTNRSPCAPGRRKRRPGWRSWRARGSGRHGGRSVRDPGRV